MAFRKAMRKDEAALSLTHTTSPGVPLGVSASLGTLATMTQTLRERNAARIDEARRQFDYDARTAAMLANRNAGGAA